ncbi:glycoside hydrolase family 5 protein [Rhodopila sp.]|uniref:glycoside hydrolase family 5 protein n=1 Tax=Rhodopila sp. TaxID=2480087 RepID=UPI003D11069E
MTSPRRTIGRWLLLLLLAQVHAVRAQQPVSLSHGINITGWFRFPVSRQPAALAGYMTDQALADLRRAGFDFVRLAIDPAVVASPADRAVLIQAIRRIQRQGLVVVVSPHPQDWHLETQPADRDRLRDFWRDLAPALQPLDPDRTVPEVLNEPVFPNDPAGWAALQHQVLLDIRQVLPRQTVVLTGQDWGSINGLLALTPEADQAVLYSFHFYDPAELTSLAAYRPGLDRTSLARLPFPATDRTACEATASLTSDAATGDLMRYYCALHWDAARIDAAFEQAADWARQHQVRLLAGEFGASIQLNPSARLAWFRTVRDGLAAHGIGWALWGYDDVMGLAVSRPPGPRPSLDRDLLAALGLQTTTLSASVRSAPLQGLP